MNKKVRNLICEAGCYQIGNGQIPFVTLGNYRAVTSRHIKQLDKEALAIVKLIGEPIFNFFAGTDFSEMMKPVIKGDYFQKSLFMAIHSSGIDYRSRMNLLYALLTNASVTDTTDEDMIGIKLMDLVFLVHCNVSLEDIRSCMNMTNTKYHKFNKDESLNQFIVKLYEHSKFSKKLLAV